MDLGLDVESKEQGGQISLHKTDPIGEEGYFFLIPTPLLEEVQSLLSTHEVAFLDEAAFEILRVEGALPKLRHELAVDFIPLETGLWEDISFNKGCYTGQEIIARMDSRNKVRRKMVRISGGEPMQVGSDIMQAGRSIGIVTSAAGTKGLGYVKTDFLTSNEGYSVDQSGVTLTLDPNSA
ncbi:MAG: hypothetical protein AAF633_25845 [Chloroflexota bacterium]